MEKPYPSNLSDTEWSCLAPHLPPPNNRGRPRAHAAREILDAIFYVLKSGLSVAVVATRLSALGDRLPLVQEVAHRRDMGRHGKG